MYRILIEGAEVEDILNRQDIMAREYNEAIGKTKRIISGGKAIKESDVGRMIHELLGQTAPLFMSYIKVHSPLQHIWLRTKSNNTNIQFEGC